MLGFRWGLQGNGTENGSSISAVGIKLGSVFGI